VSVIWVETSAGWHRSPCSALIPIQQCVIDIACESAAAGPLPHTHTPTASYGIQALAYALALAAMLALGAINERAPGATAESAPRIVAATLVGLAAEPFARALPQSQRSLRETRPRGGARTRGIPWPPPISVSR
jgi:hypothetical protein